MILTATEGQHMSKGEEFGYFQFGGSEVIVLLQGDLALRVNTDSSHRRVGEVAAHASQRQS